MRPQLPVLPDSLHRSLRYTARYVPPDFPRDAALPSASYYLPRVFNTGLLMLQIIVLLVSFRRAKHQMDRCSPARVYSLLRA